MRARIRWGLVGVVATVWATMACAQSWPTRPITIVVPFPAGGQTDVVARAVAEPMSRELGQPILIDNKPGVNGSLASDQVSKAAPDGYTLVATGPGTHGINQLVNPNVRYDARKDFTHIGLVARTSNVLLASSAFKGASVKDLVSLAKAHPKEITFALTGIGASGHMSMELLKQAAGVDFTAVPYKGDAPAITDMLGGQVQLALLPPGLAMPQVKAGKLRAVGTTSTGRSALVPEVPSLAEAGVKNYQLEIWNAVAAPASMPAAQVRKLSGIVSDIVRSPEMRQRLFQQGWQVVGSSPEGLKNRIDADTRALGDIIRQQKIELN